MTVLRTIIDGRFVMRKLICINDNEEPVGSYEFKSSSDQRLNVQELFSLTCIIVQKKEHIIEMRNCVKNLKELMQLNHPNAKPIKQVFQSPNRLVLLQGHQSDSSKLFTYLCE